MKKLPIYDCEKEILESVRINPVTIIVGETGSGKTTQIPLFLHSAGYKQIGITEPRRIAAISVAKFVADALGQKIGNKVGYQIRFDDATTSGTEVKFMTDGILLREMQNDPDLKKYNVIMVDEAHERSVNIDFILGLLKNVLSRRKDLRVIIASATIDTQKFSFYFNNAPVIEISGQVYPVEIYYEEKEVSPWKMTDAIVKKIIDVNSMPSGDILVFLPSMDLIQSIQKELEVKHLQSIFVLLVHGSLSPEEQYKIFENVPDNKRKVVLATNIAETSITIDGIVYVIDSGLIKQTTFHSETGIQSLDEIAHSQAGCNQRAGRAGRTRPGFCFRVYTKEDFLSRPEYTKPEIQRISLSGVVLAMESIGIKDIENFDFIDTPDKKAFREAYDSLIMLGAIKEKEGGLTLRGKEMARLPLEPWIGRMVLEAEKYGCVEEIIIIAAFFSVRNVFFVPKEEDAKWKAQKEHNRFKISSSDALTFLKIWKEYEVSGYNNQWCAEKFLNHRSLKEVKDIIKQLRLVLERSGKEITTLKDDKNDVVLRSVAAGLAYNLCRHQSRYAYRMEFREVYDIFFHPGSALFGGHSPIFVVVSAIVETRKKYARVVSIVRQEWLPEIFPSYFFFTPFLLCDLMEDGAGITAIRSIFDKAQKKVGTNERVLSLSEANEVQKRHIKLAKENKLILIIIENGVARFENGKLCKISTWDCPFSVTDGSYYCQERRDPWGDPIFSPFVKIFDILLDPEEEKEKMNEKLLELEKSFKERSFS